MYQQHIGPVLDGVRGQASKSAFDNLYVRSYEIGCLITILTHLTEMGFHIFSVQQQKKKKKTGQDQEAELILTQRNRMKQCRLLQF